MNFLEKMLKEKETETNITPSSEVKTPPRNDSNNKMDIIHSKEEKTLRIDSRRSEDLEDLEDIGQQNGLLKFSSLEQQKEKLTKQLIENRNIANFKKTEILRELKKKNPDIENILYNSLEVIGTLTNDKAFIKAVEKVRESKKIRLPTFIEEATKEDKQQKLDL